MRFVAFASPDCHPSAALLSLAGILSLLFSLVFIPGGVPLAHDFLTSLFDKAPSLSTTTACEAWLVGEAASSSD